MIRAVVIVMIFWAFCGVFILDGITCGYGGSWTEESSANNETVIAIGTFVEKVASPIVGYPAFFAVALLLAYKAAFYKRDLRRKHIRQRDQDKAERERLEFQYIMRK